MQNTIAITTPAINALMNVLVSFIYPYNLYYIYYSSVALANSYHIE